jgi:hypothetical protein
MSHVLSDLFKKLELNKENGLYMDGDDLPNYPSRIKISLENIDYDAFYNFNNKPLILFKEFKSVDEEKIRSLHTTIWNFGETPILFVVLPNEIRIYNGFVFEKGGNEAWKTIDSILNEEINEFSFLNIVSDKIWKIHGAEFNRKKHVQTYLLKNLKDAKNVLRRMDLPLSTINNLIGRLIFSRYLIDRNILSRNFFHENYKCDFEQLILDKEKLYNYFQYLKNKFNGDLFPISENETFEVNINHLKVLNDLFKGNEIITGQTVLFDVYDFSIIPIELISNIYETFLSEESYKSNKAYYTPLFLVDYILNTNLDGLLDEKDSEDCKILDPACGSGVFLVESLRRLINKSEITKCRDLRMDEIKNLLLNNIFGFDEDENAINISIFSLYLALLDYQEIKSINDFKFPKLKNKNIFVGDFFDEENKFNNIPPMDIIVGNPPWGVSNKKAIEYAKNNSIPISHKEIAQCFLARVKDFAKPSTQIALIVTSKVLYNLKAINFRQYFMKNFIINEILEFSSLRRGVFENAIGPGTIIFYKISNSEYSGSNIIKHVSIKPNRFFDLFRAIVIEKYDIKYIMQKYFLEFDWLWKVMLYGNIFDFYFIKRLKQDYESIKDVIHENDLDHGVGINVNGPGKLKNVKNMIGNPYLNTKSLNRYFIDKNGLNTWNIEKVYRSSKENLFKAPHVLIKKSPNSDFKMISAFSDDDMIFREPIMAISGRKNQINLLKNISGIINSELMSYFIFLTGSSIAVERDIVSPAEIISFPAVLNDNIIKIIDKIQQCYTDLNYSNDLKDNGLENELNERICDLYGLNSTERDLIDYMINVSIPLFKNQSKATDPIEKDQLKQYSQIFIDHFQNKLKNSETFLVDIYLTEYFVAMNFKIESKNRINQVKFVQNDDIHDIIHKIGILSFENIKNRLYIQRDVKGFETSSFYIIKPNESKNWHRAIARLDLSEFINAIIKADMVRYEVE